MSSTLSTKCHFWKNTWALAILLEHMQKKFEINQTKIKGGWQSGRKVVPHDSKSFASRWMLFKRCSLLTLLGSIMEHISHATKCWSKNDSIDIKIIREILYELAGGILGQFCIKMVILNFLLLLIFQRRFISKPIYFFCQMAFYSKNEIKSQHFFNHSLNCGSCQIEPVKL